VAGIDGEDSMFQFRLEMGDNRTKRCYKIKRRQRTRLDSMGMKRVMTQRCGDIGWRRGDTGERKEKI
jgi:hypothetical protein